MSYRGRENALAASLLAEVKEAQGDKQAACHWYDEAIAEARGLEDKWLLSSRLIDKGRVLHDDEQYEEAALAFEASLILDRELGYGVYRTLNRFALIPKTAICSVK